MIQTQQSTAVLLLTMPISVHHLPMVASSKITHRVTQIISNWFRDHDYCTQNTSKVMWGTVDSHYGCAATNLQQLCDAIKSIWTKIRNVFSTLLKLCHGGRSVLNSS